MLLLLGDPARLGRGSLRLVVGAVQDLLVLQPGVRDEAAGVVLRLSDVLVRRLLRLRHHVDRLDGRDVHVDLRGGCVLLLDCPACPACPPTASTSTRLRRK